MEYRTLDGYGNNLNHPNWGRALAPLFRHPGLYAYTADGHTPAGADRPNPRRISNIVCSQVHGGTTNGDRLSDFMWAWGQFLDHELDLTDAAQPSEELDIPTPAGDPQLPDGGRIPFKRSRFDPSTGGDASKPREQINLLSSYIDASNVYGVNVARASVLREHTDGKLKSSADRLLPKNSFHLPNDHGPERPGVVPGEFFVAGDIRCNEHVVLTTMHTLWMREHNRICEELIGVSKIPCENDEELFQEARRRVIAEVQAITFEEFLPALLGASALPTYSGYKANVDASVGNIFSTVAYRLGHSMVSPVIQRVPTDAAAPPPPLRLEEAFWNPGMFAQPRLVDEILNGLSQQLMQQVDTRAVDGLRNLLFMDQLSGSPNALLDLAALNIQRGRDHGLPSYNQCRSALGLAPKRDVRDVTSDSKTQGRLLMAYQNDVELIDPWVGGLAEDHVDGAQVGELFFHVIRDQFIRLRDGDRFWYEAPDAGFTDDEIDDLRQTRLAQVIQRNTSVTPATDDVFRVVSE